MGHISARHDERELGNTLYLAEFFQTDAAINRGNSGGPMFDMSGKVIGIVSHIKSESGGYEGLGFAVTSNTARSLMLEKKTFWSGINAISMTPVLARAINYPLKHGALVQQVAKESPAGLAGIRGGSVLSTIGKKKMLLGGDVIVSVLGIPLKSKKNLLEIRWQVREMKNDTPIPVKIYRAGAFMEKSLLRQ